MTSGIMRQWLKQVRLFRSVRSFSGWRLDSEKEQIHDKLDFDLSNGQIELFLAVAKNQQVIIDKYFHNKTVDSTALKQSERYLLKVLKDMQKQRVLYAIKTDKGHILFAIAGELDVLKERPRRKRIPLEKRMDNDGESYINQRTGNKTCILLY